MKAKTACQAVLLVLVVAVAAAACGGSSKKASTTPTTLPAAVVSYVQCLQSHGIPSTPTSTLPPAQVSAAHTACQAQAPPQKATSYRNCLKAFGVSAKNLKTPTATRADAHYPAASQICSNLRKKAASST
jgi:hypothetical protein